MLQVKNPATGEVIATVPCMKANETSAAVAEATSAWPEWSKMVAKERSKIMRKYVLCTVVTSHMHAVAMAQEGSDLACTCRHVALINVTARHCREQAIICMSGLQSSPSRV